MKISPKLPALLLGYALLAFISNESITHSTVSSPADRAFYGFKIKDSSKGGGSSSSKTKPGGSAKPSPGKSKPAPGTGSKGSKSGKLDKFTEPYKKKDKPAASSKDKGGKDKGGKDKGKGDKDKDDDDNDNNKYKDKTKKDKKDKDRGRDYDYNDWPDGYEEYYKDRERRPRPIETEISITYSPRYPDDETFTSDNGFRYSYYPYCAGEPAGSVYVHLMPENIRDVPYADVPAFQVRTFYQSVKKDILVNGIYGKILTASGFTFDGSLQSYGESVNGNTEYMRYVDAHLATCGFNADDDTVFEMGVGGAWLGDTDNFEYHGVSLKTSIDYFPGQPWGVHFYGAYALIEHKPLAKLNLDFSYHDDIVELYLGCHSLINSRGDSLTGPAIGVGFWF